MSSDPEALRRGSIVRVRLDPIVGSEQGGERPVPVISPDLINTHSPIVLVAALTSKKTDRVYPFEALIEPPDGGITARSKVMLVHLRSVDKSRITGVQEGTMLRVEEALQVAVGLIRT